MAYTVRVDAGKAKAALRNAHRRAKAGPRAFLDIPAMSKWALARAQTLSPERTGDFKSRWRIVRTRGSTWDAVMFRLENSHHAAKAILYGTRPHWIEAMRGVKSSLKFETADGETVYAPAVFHPGTKPHRVDRAVFSELSRVWTRFKK